MVLALFGFGLGTAPYIWRGPPGAFLVFACLVSAAHGVQASAYIAGQPSRFTVWSARAYIFAWVNLTAILAFAAGIIPAIALTVIALGIHMLLTLRTQKIAPRDLLGGVAQLLRALKS